MDNDLYYNTYFFFKSSSCKQYVWPGFLDTMSNVKTLSQCTALKKYGLSISFLSSAICTLLLNYILNLGRLAALNWWGWFQTQKRNRFVPQGNVHTNSFTTTNKLQSPRVHNINSQRIRWVLNLVIVLLKPQRSWLNIEISAILFLKSVCKLLMMSFTLFLKNNSLLNPYFDRAELLSVTKYHAHTYLYIYT